MKWSTRDRIGLMRGELIAIGTPETLKAEFMHEDVLEVMCDHLQDATSTQTAARDKGGCAFGRGLHVVVDNSEAAGRIPEAALGK